MTGSVGNSIPLLIINAFLQNLPFTLPSLFISTHLFIVPELQFPLKPRPRRHKSHQQLQHVHILHQAASMFFPVPPQTFSYGPHICIRYKILHQAHHYSCWEEETLHFINWLLPYRGLRSLYILTSPVLYSFGWRAQGGQEDSGETTTDL